MRPQTEVDIVLNLIENGRTDTEIGEITGIPRTTVRDWRMGVPRLTDRHVAGDEYRCGHKHAFGDLPAEPYSYLLGLYLGDGYVAKSRRVWRLRVTLDERYPGIVDECCAAMEAVMSGQRAGLVQRKTRCVDVSMYSKHWPCLLPQHGPGRKHERDISLLSWQEELLASVPESFLRGLIHSDGCRVETLDRGVPSVRYHFSNKSEDIKDLYCRYLEELGINWTRPCDKQIAVYRQSDVALMDEFIGPKQ